MRKYVFSSEKAEFIFGGHESISWYSSYPQPSDLNPTLSIEMRKCVFSPERAEFIFGGYG